MSKQFKFFVVITMIIFVSGRHTFAQDEILFRKHIVNSGWHGLFYGLALNGIFETEGAAAAGIPIITAGVSAMIPLLASPSKSITVNSLMLSDHGKYMGWVHGAALMSLLGGEDIWEDNYKLPLALSALSSIGLGRLGYSLGKNKTWAEGHAALFRLYGGMMSLTGFFVGASFADDFRVFSGSVMLFGAGGYLLADQVFKLNPYTRGDVRATSVVTSLHGLLGFGIVADKGIEDEFARADWLLPAAGLLVGTGIGHLWLKNAGLTSQQGTLTGYAASGGAVIGLGIALMIDSDKLTPWYAIPYATGMAAYAYAVERFKKNNLAYGIDLNEKKNDWNIAFMPHNILFNQQLNNRKRSPYGGLFTMQPAIAATLNF